MSDSLCHECSSPIRATAAACPSCGAPVRRVEAPIATPGPRPSEPTIAVATMSASNSAICPLCGAPLAENATKCRSCGEWVVPLSRSAASHFLEFAGACWIVLSILGGLVGWSQAAHSPFMFGGQESAYVTILLAATAGGTFGLLAVVVGASAPRTPNGRRPTPKRWASDLWKSI